MPGWGTTGSRDGADNGAVTRSGTPRSPIGPPGPGSGSITSRTSPKLDDAAAPAHTDAWAAVFPVDTAPTWARTEAIDLTRGGSRGLGRDHHLGSLLGCVRPADPVHVSPMGLGARGAPRGPDRPGTVARGRRIGDGRRPRARLGRATATSPASTATATPGVGAGSMLISGPTSAPVAATMTAMCSSSSPPCRCGRSSTACRPSPTSACGSTATTGRDSTVRRSGSARHSACPSGGCMDAIGRNKLQRDGSPARRSIGVDRLPRSRRRDRDVHEQRAGRRRDRARRPEVRQAAVVARGNRSRRGGDTTVGKPMTAGSGHPGQDRDDQGDRRDRHVHQGWDRDRRERRPAAPRRRRHPGRQGGSGGRADRRRADPDDRRHRPLRVPGVHRPAHALRRPGVLGPHAVAVADARRHDRDRGQLRLLGRSSGARGVRLPDAHARPCRGHAHRDPEGGVRLGLDLVRLVPRSSRGSPGAEHRVPRRALGDPPGGDGRGGVGT